MKRLLYLMAAIFMIYSVKISAKKFVPGGAGETPAELMKYVDGDRYADDLAVLAVDRTLGSPGHKMAMEFCRLRLMELGFKTELDSYGTGTNVIGYLEGSDKSEEAVILSAHYDSKNQGCPGADDNASGVSGVLEAARVLARNKYHRTLIVALWDEEEKGLVSPRGLIGSRSFAARARRDGKKIILSVVYEMIGYRSNEINSQKFPAFMKRFFPVEMKKISDNQNRGDFICVTVNKDAGSYSDIYRHYADAVSLPSLILKISNKIINIHAFRRSDHAAFWEQGYSAMVIGDTINYRNNNYHCNNGGVDSIEKLDTAFARDNIKATVASLAEILMIR